MDVKKKRRKSSSVVSSSLPGPWLSWTRTLSCKSRDVVLVAPSHKQHPHHRQQQQQQQQQQQVKYKSRSSFYSPSSASSSACNCSNLKDVIHGNTRVVHRASSAGSPRSNKDVDDLSPSTDAGIFSPDESHEAPLVSLSSSAQHRKKFGCNGCNVAVDTMVEYSSMVAVKSCNFPQLACLKCGEYFNRIDALEQHHAMHHAVSEVPRGDSSRNIIEIIFRSSWTTPQAVCGKIERVLKVHNSQRTLARFEEYRDAVKSRANVAASATSNATVSRKNTTNNSSSSSSSSSCSTQARCIADGNELLRFYGTSLTCALGANGSSSLCSSPSCGVCRIARWGFSSSAKSSKGTAIRTTATSSTAHWQAAVAGSASGDRQALTRRTAMVVCRVVAGRSYKTGGSTEGATMLLPAGFDSVELGGSDDGHEDLLVFNSKAVLPCFVVIYKC